MNEEKRKKNLYLIDQSKREDYFFEDDYEVI